MTDSDPDPTSETNLEASLDPTTGALAAQIAERDRLRVENDRLSKALVAAYTEIEVLKAELGRLTARGEEKHA